MNVKKRLTVLSALGVGIMSAVILIQSPISGSANLRQGRDTLITDQEVKTKIKHNEWPTPVKKSLESDAFEGWRVTNVYVISKDESEKDYEIELRKDQEAQLVRFDKDGRLK